MADGGPNDAHRLEAPVFMDNRVPLELAAETINRCRVRPQAGANIAREEADLFNDLVPEGGDDGPEQFEPADPVDPPELLVGDNDGHRDSPVPFGAPDVISHERRLELFGEVSLAVRRGDLWLVKEEFLERKQMLLLGNAPDAELARADKECEYVLGLIKASLYFGQSMNALGHMMVHLQDRFNNQGRQLADEINRNRELRNENERDAEYYAELTQHGHQLLQQTHAANAHTQRVYDELNRVVGERNQLADFFHQSEQFRAEQHTLVQQQRNEIVQLRQQLREWKFCALTCAAQTLQLGGPMPQGMQLVLQGNIVHVGLVQVADGNPPDLVDVMVPVGGIEFNQVVIAIPGPAQNLVEPDGEPAEGELPNDSDSGFDEHGNEPQQGDADGDAGRDAGDARGAGDGVEGGDAGAVGGDVGAAGDGAVDFPEGDLGLDDLFALHGLPHAPAMSPAPPASNGSDKENYRPNVIYCTNPEPMDSAEPMDKVEPMDSAETMDSEPKIRGALQKLAITIDDETPIVKQEPKDELTLETDQPTCSYKNTMGSSPPKRQRPTPTDSDLDSDGEPPNKCSTYK